MSKNNNQSKYGASLRKISFGETATFDRNDRNEIISEIQRFNKERSPYHFDHSVNKGAVQVTRVVPTNFQNRKLYIDSIGKSQLTSALRSSNWNKEATARTFGISARSIGRMIEKHGITATATKSTKTSTSKSSSSSKKSKSKSGR